jgi:hypothetical protein
MRCRPTSVGRQEARRNPAGHGILEAKTDDTNLTRFGNKFYRIRRDEPGSQFDLALQPYAKRIKVLARWGRGCPTRLPTRLRQFRSRGITLARPCG